jgi:hypothetical protein
LRASCPWLTLQQGYGRGSSGNLRAKLRGPVSRSHPKIETRTACYLKGSPADRGQLIYGADS